MGDRKRPDKKDKKITRSWYLFSVFSKTQRKHTHTHGIVVFLF